MGHPRGLGAQKWTEGAFAVPEERLHAPELVGARARRADATIAVARGAVRRPAVTWRHARSPSRRKRFMRAWTVALSPDLLHAPSMTLAREWSDLATALGARLVVTVPGEEAVEAAVGGPALPPAARALHADSEEIAALVDGETGAPVAVIPPSPDPTFLRESCPARAIGRPVRILSVGPLSWTSGYEYALAAVKLLMDRGIFCRYRIAGAGAYRDAVSFARHQLELDDCVELVEPRSRADLLELYRWAEVLVDASVAPNSPKPILDAHAAGVAVLATTRGADGEAVLGVPRRDPGAIAEVLAELVLNEGLAQQLVAAGRQAALRAPTADDQAAGLGELYQRVLAGSR